MALVFIHHDFAPQLSLSKRKWIAQQFAEYQDAPDELCGDVFGRDKANVQPREAVSLRVHHAHMVTEECEEKWLDLAEEGATRIEFTSDRILMYARISPDHRHDVYLLLEHIEAPNGHEFMRTPNVYPALCERVKEIPQRPCSQLKANWLFVDTRPRKSVQVHITPR